MTGYYRIFDACIDKDPNAARAAFGWALQEKVLRGMLRGTNDAAPQPGQVRSGRIVARTGDTFLVNVEGSKFDVELPLSLCEGSERVGGDTTFAVLAADEEVMPTGSVREARRFIAINEAWDLAETSLANQQPVTVKVSKVVRRKSDGKPAGLQVNLGVLQGFMPLSKIDSGRLADRTAAGLIEQLYQFADEELQVLVLQADRRSNSLKFDHAGAVRQLAEAAFAELFEGQSVLCQPTGFGRNERGLYGLFVQLAPGVQGLLHISKMAPELQAGVRLLFNQDMVPGEIELEILSIDRDKRRIALCDPALERDSSGSARSKRA